MDFKKEREISYIKAILQGFVKDFDSFTIRKDWFKGIIWGTGNQAQLTKCHRFKSHFLVDTSDALVCLPNGIFGVNEICY